MRLQERHSRSAEELRRKNLLVWAKHVPVETDTVLVSEPELLVRQEVIPVGCGLVLVGRELLTVGFALLSYY